MNICIKISETAYPLKQEFKISRGAKTCANVVQITLFDGEFTGRGESVPYARYDESVESVVAQINSATQPNMSQESLETAIACLGAGAARNALDCAYWDLKSKQQHCSVSDLLSLPSAPACVTAQTLSISSPEEMAKAAQDLDNPPLIKVKLDADNIIGKMQAIHSAAPKAKFIVDANESWHFEQLETVAPLLAKLNVVLIEQPLPKGNDDILIDYLCPIPLCADESCHTRKDLPFLNQRYQAINIKLDKTGGLTEAHALLLDAKQQGFQIMLGCMVGSSLAMAPAFILSPLAQFVDLDGPWLLANDIDHGFDYINGVMQSIPASLWGNYKS